MKLEFNWFLDARTKQMKLQILNSKLEAISILDARDFKHMETLQLNPGILTDVVNYSNLCKGTNIGEFVPTVF